MHNPRVWETSVFQVIDENNQIILDALHELVPFLQFKNMKNTHWGVLLSVKPATLLKITLLHGCFSRYLNFTNGTKLLKTYLRILWWVVSPEGEDKSFSFWSGDSRSSWNLWKSHQAVLQAWYKRKWIKAIK